MICGPDDEGDKRSFDQIAACKWDEILEMCTSLILPWHDTIRYDRRV